MLRYNLATKFGTALLGTLIFFGSMCTSMALAKPLIGITTDVEGQAPKEATISFPYFEAIEKAGGIPVLLPPMSDEDAQSVLARLDGILFIGGADYPPACYGQKMEPMTHVMADERSKSDLALAKAALAESSMPILGICAGSQLLNIAAGGTLMQDIPSTVTGALQHASKNGWTQGWTKHPIELEKGSRLAAIYGTTPLSVVSSHHQCVGKLASSFRIVARASDNVPEAIEMPGDRFVIGVQYHPERDFETNKRLFETFVAQASKRRK